MFFVVTFDDILYMCHQATGVDSLAPMEFEWNLRHVIFKRILVIGGWGISCEIALIWISLDFTYDPSTLVQVSLYLSQCSPRSLSPYGVTMPQWVKAAILLWQDSFVFHIYETGKGNSSSESMDFATTPRTQIVSCNITCVFSFWFIISACRVIVPPLRRSSVDKARYFVIILLLLFSGIKEIWHIRGLSFVDIYNIRDKW